MSNIDFLVKNYDKKRIPYEDRGNEYDKQRKREERQRELKDIAYDLFAECENYKKLQLSSYQRIRVIYLVETFGKNIKKLHGTTKKESIILAFIFYIKLIELGTINLEDYKIFSEYGLTNKILLLIISRLCEHYMRNSPILPSGSTSYDHELLSRHGGKI
ncbi:hypothetical protein [Methanobrevibacter sp.]|uniref:hypothetical protein n=1 Tax=Methanobrevibacter sp. TaxID=66852 RepID=UPI00388E754C